MHYLIFLLNAINWYLPTYNKAIHSPIFENCIAINFKANESSPAGVDEYGPRLLHAKSGTISHQLLRLAHFQSVPLFRGVVQRNHFFANTPNGESCLRQGIDIPAGIKFLSFRTIYLQVYLSRMAILILRCNAVSRQHFSLWSLSTIIKGRFQLLR